MDVPPTSSWPRLLSWSLFFLMLSGCQPDVPSRSDATHYYGTPVSVGEAVPVQAVAAEPTLYTGRTTTLEGRVTRVNTQGGTLTLDANGTSVRVRAARGSHGTPTFSLPSELEGAHVIARGIVQAPSSSTTEIQVLARGLVVEKVEI